jgi:hypothetical protein
MEKAGVHEIERSVPLGRITTIDLQTTVERCKTRGWRGKRTARAGDGTARAGDGTARAGDAGE